MAISEAARHDLYTGLSELLGPERTETLMSALPIYDLDEVATKGDIAELRAEIKGDIAELRAEIKGDIAVINARLYTLETGITAIGSRLDDQTQRLDKLILTQYAGLVAFAAALIGILITR